MGGPSGINALDTLDTLDTRVAVVTGAARNIGRALGAYRMLYRAPAWRTRIKRFGGRIRR